MSATTLFIGIIVFIILLIICIHAYDRHLVKEIKIYEKRLEKKGIFKRHFIKTGSSKKKIIIKCKNCSNEFVVEDNDIPAIGRIVKCSHCSATWRQMPNIA
tara:strand:+ start:88 stop:390 length:303 start_codon:yes stop_codon:yes gene_type:complete